VGTKCTQSWGYYFYAVGFQLRILLSLMSAKYVMRSLTLAQILYSTAAFNIISHFHVHRYDVRPGGEGLKAPEGEGCGRCGFFVYAAEQMLCKGKV